MSIRNQPYIPLYVQDFMTDEKLAECSAESTGVYIRLMCLMHKSDPYGKILLKQKFKQTTNQITNFASQIAKHMPYDLVTVERSILELHQEGVLIIDGDFLLQKRMVKDAELSEKRSKSGSKGGLSAQEKRKEVALNFAIAKPEANTEYEIENTNEIIKERGEGENPLNEKLLVPEMWSKFKEVLKKYPGNMERDFKPLLSIANFLHTELKLNGKVLESQRKIMTEWELISKVISGDIFYKQKSLSVISNHIQEIYQIHKDGKQTNSSNKSSNSGVGRTLEFDEI